MKKAAWIHINLYKKMKIFEDKWSQTRETAQQILLALLKNLKKHSFNFIKSVLLTQTASNDSRDHQYPSQRRHFPAKGLKDSRIRKEEPPGSTKKCFMCGTMRLLASSDNGNCGGKKSFNETAFKQEKSTAEIFKLLIKLCWLILDPGRLFMRLTAENLSNQTPEELCRPCRSSYTPLSLQFYASSLLLHPSSHLCSACVCVCAFLPRLMVSHHTSSSLSPSQLSPLGWLQLANRIKF